MSGSLAAKVTSFAATVSAALFMSASWAQQGARSVPAEDLAAAATDKNWSAPRTSWGHPSLEGIWSTDDMRSVPRSRPEEFGMRAKCQNEAP